MFDYKDRVVVITGASSGLGFQMAKGFAAQGANLVLLARRKEKLEENAKIIRDMGVKCLPVQCDIKDEKSVTSAVEQTISEFGKVDVVINNAGSGNTDPIEELTVENWKECVDMDLNTVFLVTREFGKPMIKAGSGRVINIASMYGLVGNTMLPSSAYHAAKGGVVNFTRAAAAEWAKYNITVNCICPGYFATELTIDTLETSDFQQYMQATVPLGRYGKEGELNSAALFLGAEESSYVTGVIIPVDGGYTCV